MGEFYGHTNVCLKKLMIAINVHHLSLRTKRTYAAIEHTQEKEHITRTPIFPKSDTKTFREKI
jgi:hypothetical protein